jgi:hypothetical protein
MIGPRERPRATKVIATKARFMLNRGIAITAF